MGTRRDNAEAALTQWRANHEQRDDLVRKANKAGININRIHTLTGIGRSTIYRILTATNTDPTTSRRGKKA
jgi:hypothetical protein